jgi:hypothetical protein
MALHTTMLPPPLADVGGSTAPSFHLLVLDLVCTYVQPYDSQSILLHLQIGTAFAFAPSCMHAVTRSAINLLLLLASWLATARCLLPAAIGLPRHTLLADA